MPLAFQEVRQAFVNFFGSDDSVQYSQLPFSRTSTLSSASDSEDGGAFQPKPASVWHTHRKAILASAGILATAAVVSVGTVVHLNRGTSAVEACSGTVGPWYRHPSAYKEERVRSRQDDPLQPTYAQQAMSQPCTDQWISQGQKCAEVQAAKSLPDVVTDVAWTFVEPTEHWRTWKAAYKGIKETAEQKAEKLVHFRSYDEIRYSIRSVAANLPFVRRKTLLATSLSEALPKENASIASFSEYQPKQCRVAQIPDWLDTESVALLPGSSPKVSDLEVLSHWELFDSRAKSAKAAHEPKQPCYQLSTATL